MTRAASMATCVALILASVGCVKAKAAPGALFAATHVTLYDCGLAQIERQAEVEGATNLMIKVEQAHIDDLLASLVLATDGTVKVKEVRFPGVKNLGQAVASSSFAASMADGADGLAIPSDLAGYAQALVGTKVTVTGKKGDKVEGTVLDAVVPPAAQGVNGSGDGKSETAEGDPLMVIVTSAGSLRWIQLSDVAEVAPVSQLEAAAIKSFSAALGKASGFTETTLVLETAPGSSGKLAASYIRQSPVWRMLYKTTVEAGKVSLEAWAVVQNDTPEDWQDVGMTLVSGLPTSYVLSVASPRYVSREVLDHAGGWDSMAPQLGAKTPDSLLFDWNIYHASALSMEGLSGYGYGGGGGGSAGYGFGTLGTIGHGGGGGETGSSLIKLGESAAEEAMTAQVEKEISTYSSMSTVSLPSGATSLVPLMRRDLPAQPFTQLMPGGDAETCLRMENTTGLVLQPGMSTFYVDGLFRGQDELDRVEPGDVRVPCYGKDPDVSFDYVTDVKNVFTALEWKADTLWVHTLRTTTRDYTVENFAGQAREIAIPITHIKNGRVVIPSQLLSTQEDTTSLHLFTAGPRSKQEKRIVVEEGVMTVVDLGLVSFGPLLKSPDLPADHKKVLEAAAAVVAKKEKLDEEIAAKRALIDKNEKGITFQMVLLAGVPATGGKSKMVDAILKEVMAARKQVTALEAEIKVLEEKVSKLMGEAGGELKKLPKPEAKKDVP